MAPRLKRRARGVSLIEALVALAVVGIGMIGMVGVQATLRGNADVSKQRSTAVRLLQSGTEEWRAFAILEADANVNFVDYTDLDPNAAKVDTTGVDNANFERTREIVELAAPLRGKLLAATVDWTDRAGDTQTVQLATVIAGIAPELAASLAIPADGDPVRLPQGRHRGIPVKAKDLGGGKSALKPPGALPTLVWRFDNVTGLIDLCQTEAANRTEDLTAANVVNCNGLAIPLTGFVRYHLNGTPPTKADALAPASAPPAAPLSVSVAHSLPSAGTTTCFTKDETSAPFFTSYFCAIPVAVGETAAWSGRLSFGPAGRIATTAAPEDSNPMRVRICRYFETSALPDPADDSNDGNYTAVTGPLANQNYLVMNAGDGANPFACPTASAVTRQHQP